MMMKKKEEKKQGRTYQLARCKGYTTAMVKQRRRRIIRRR